MNSKNVNYTIPNLLDEVIIFPDKITTDNTISFSDYFKYFYLSIVLILTVRILYGIVLITVLYHKGKRSDYLGVKLVVCNKNINPFSVFNTVFINVQHIDKDSLDQIMTHEKVHIRQMHSFDNIVSGIACTLFWINPFFWISKLYLKSTHEYQADEKVREQGFDLAGYFMLLLNNVVGIRVGLANNFNQSLTLKRMKMMKRNRSPRYVRWLYLLVVPFMAILIITMSCQNTDGSFKKTTNNSIIDKSNNGSTVSDQNDKIYDQVDKMPVYGNGQDDLINYLVSSIKYPEKARQDGIQGKVFIEFMVSETGKVKDVKVKKSVNKLLDAEAIRVITNMPDWNPGEKDGKAVNVKMTLPISFKLENQKEK